MPLLLYTEPTDENASVMNSNSTPRGGTWAPDAADHSPVAQDATAPIDVAATTASPLETFNTNNAAVFYARCVALEAKLDETRNDLRTQQNESLDLGHTMDIMLEERGATNLLATALSRTAEKLAADACGPGVDIGDVNHIRLLLGELMRYTCDTGVRR